MPLIIRAGSTVGFAGVGVALGIGGGIVVLGLGMGVEVGNVGAGVTVGGGDVATKIFSAVASMVIARVGSADWNSGTVVGAPQPARSNDVPATKTAHFRNPDKSIAGRCLRP